MQSHKLMRSALDTHVKEHAGVVPGNQGLQAMTDMSAKQQAAIVDIAKQAMIDEFGFTKKTLTLLTVDIIPSNEYGKTYGVASFSPDYAQDPAGLQVKMGYYFITVEVETGKVLKSMWSGQSQWDDKGYIQNNWATAPAYHASILPWMLELNQKINEIGSRYAPAPRTSNTVMKMPSHTTSYSEMSASPQQCIRAPCQAAKTFLTIRLWPLPS